VSWRISTGLRISEKSGTADSNRSLWTRIRDDMLSRPVRSFDDGWTTLLRGTLGVSGKNFAVSELEAAL